MAGQGGLGVILQYDDRHTYLYLIPENDDEVKSLTDLFYEKVVLVNDSHVTVEGRLSKLCFKVYTRK